MKNDVRNWRLVAERCLKDEAAAILELIPKMDANFERAMHLVLACKGKLIVTGVGKSGHIGAKIAATLSSTGTPSFFVNPLDVFHGDLGVITEQDVVLAISNSGETDELLRFLPYLQSRSIPVIGMSGNPTSKLARYTDAHLNVAVPSEAYPLRLAPTTSTTATLAMGDAFACALMEARGFQEKDFAGFHPGGSLGKRLLTTANDVMRTNDLPTISPNALLGDAVSAVSNGRMGLCVATEAGVIQGIITDGDIRRAIQRSQDSFFEMRVADIMTAQPKTVTIDTKIIDIEKIMNENKIHSVLVSDNEKQLLGIVDSFSIAL